MDDDKGTGLVLVNTEKGSQSLDWGKVTMKESSIEVASKYNGGLSSQTKPPPKRTEFFAALDTSSSVISLVDKCLRPPFKRRVRIVLGGYKRHLLTILKNLAGGQ